MPTGREHHKGRLSFPEKVCPPLVLGVNAACEKADRHAQRRMGNGWKPRTWHDGGGKKGGPFYTHKQGANELELGCVIEHVIKIKFEDIYFILQNLYLAFSNCLQVGVSSFTLDNPVANDCKSA